MAILLTAPAQLKLSKDEKLFGLILALFAAWLLTTLILPLIFVLIRSFHDAGGAFIGLRNYLSFFATPGLAAVVWNSLFISSLATIITIALALVYAYALARTCVRAKSFFRGVALIPLLAPSMLPAIAFIFLFGNQGLLRDLLFGYKVYGPIGIVLGEVFYAFPHALIILTAALSTADARLYEAATSLRASSLKILLTVTLPSLKYGLTSAVFVVFTLIITDFGVPTIIGGQYSVLATEVYKQVVGRQDFEIGAVVSMILLIPAVLAFFADRIAQRRQVALLSARSVPYEPKPNPAVDWAFFSFCVLISGIILGILTMAFLGSLVELWPYNLSLSFQNYDFTATTDVGWGAYSNSLRMALLTAIIGTAIVFLGAYTLEKIRRYPFSRKILHFSCMLPMAVPGLVLGVAYIFFFNHPNNPLNVLYGSMSLLVICNIIHFYSVSHITAATALKQIDNEFEAISASLKVPLIKTFFRVTVPVCLPAILDISIYFFVNSMTTVSALVFLYSSQTMPASVAVMFLDDNGAIAPAAAMAIMIVITSGIVRALHWLATRRLASNANAWRFRTAEVA